MIDFGEAGDYFKIKEDSKFYFWPCEDELQRTIQIFGGDSPDVLVRTAKDTYNCVTGIYKKGIKIPDEDVVEVKGDTRHLVMGGL